jgi:hypothetical protein
MNILNYCDGLVTVLLTHSEYTIFKILIDFKDNVINCDIHASLIILLAQLPHNPTGVTSILTVICDILFMVYNVTYGLCEDLGVITLMMMSYRSRNMLGKKV